MLCEYVLLFGFLLVLMLYWLVLFELDMVIIVCILLLNLVIYEDI